MVLKIFLCRPDGLCKYNAMCGVVWDGQLASPGSEGIQGIQAVTMTNSGGTQQAPTILQYAHTPDGQQILVPSNQVVVQGELLSCYYFTTFLVLKIVLFCEMTGATIKGPSIYIKMLSCI